MTTWHAIKRYKKSQNRSITYCDFVLGTVLPVVRSRELFSEDKLESSSEASSHGNHACHAVMQGKGRVHHVAAANPDDETTTPRREDVAVSGIEIRHPIDTQCI